MKFIKQFSYAKNLIKTAGKKTVVAGFLLSSLVLSGVNVAQASDAESFEKLTQIKVAMALKGYSCRNGVNGRYLQQGQTYTTYTTLNKDLDYILVAAGNVHVKDIDIILYDENHHVIARDSSIDSTPMVYVSPKWTGEFYAEVKMYEGKGYSNVMVCFR